MTNGKQTTDGRRIVSIHEDDETVLEALDDPNAVVVLESVEGNRDAYVNEGYDPQRDDMFGR